MKQQFKVQNMKCMGCVSAVKAAVEPLPGVSAVEVDLEGGQAVVEGEFDVAEVAAAITAAGYPAEPAG
jgi:copper chaperone CopZ